MSYPIFQNYTISLKALDSAFQMCPSLKKSSRRVVMTNQQYHRQSTIWSKVSERILAFAIYLQGSRFCLSSESTFLLMCSSDNVSESIHQCLKYVLTMTPHLLFFLSTQFSSKFTKREMLLLVHI